MGPQEGPQTVFLGTTADIALYGGQAGGGKTWAILLQPVAHIENPYFGGVIFRRTTPQIRNKGGMWDQSKRLYPLANARPREDRLEWVFPMGSTMKFSHMELESSVLDWQGSEIPYIGFDELTHFTRYQFTYMLSRNRSTCGVTPYIRATCNPDPDSWVAELVAWWIDQATGYPIPERAGVLRWFIVQHDKFVWGDSKEELEKNHGKDCMPLSFTFIPAKLSDNPQLEKKDPSYRAKLNALGTVERERLLKGNWKIRASAGNVFKAEWFPLVDVIPGGWLKAIRAWDRAATAPNPGNPDPDWTRGVLMYFYPDSTVCIADLKSTRDTPSNVERLIRNVAGRDGHGVAIRGFEDPGSAGKKESEDFIRLFQGYDVKVERATGKKLSRAIPLSRQAEAGNVKVLKGVWNDELFHELEGFSEDDKDYAHDDIVDACTLAFSCGITTGMGFSNEFVNNFEKFMSGGRF